MYVTKFTWNGLREHKPLFLMVTKENYGILRLKVFTSFRELLIAEMYSKLMRET